MDCCSVKLTQTVQAQVTKPAPQFSAAAYYNGITKVSLSDYKGKYVVLFFYPLDFTFVCPTEIISFSEKAEEFRKAGCEVIAASTDSVYSHMEYVQKPRAEGGLGKMNIPILADTTRSIATTYGCLKEDEGIAFRATYIIDGNGILRHLSINDLPVGRNVDEVLRLVQAFKFADENGDVCPEKWTPGSKTMKPTHDDPKTVEYWKSVHAAKGGN